MSQVNELKNLNIFEVSVVPKGANRKKFFLLKGDYQMDELLKKIDEIKLNENFKNVFEKMQLTEEEKNALESALKLLQALKDKLPEDLLKQLYELLGYPAPYCAAPEYYAAPTKKEEEQKNEIEKMDESIKQKFETILKEKEEIAKKAKELEEELQKQKIEKEKIEFVAKIDSEYKNIAGDKKELANALFEIRNTQAFSVIDRILKSADVALSNSVLTQELGTSVEGSGSAWELIEKAASELVKQDKNLTMQKAIYQVIKSNPKLYQNYLNERS
jgi:hypothetical protein